MADAYKGWEPIEFEDAKSTGKVGDVFRVGEHGLEVYRLGTDIERRDISTIVIEAIEGAQHEHGYLPPSGVHRATQAARDAMTEAVLQVVDFLVEDDNIDAAIRVRQNFIKG